MNSLIIPTVLDGEMIGVGVGWLQFLVGKKPMTSVKISQMVIFKQTSGQ